MKVLVPGTQYKMMKLPDHFLEMSDFFFKHLYSFKSQELEVGSGNLYFCKYSPVNPDVSPSWRVTNRKKNTAHVLTLILGLEGFILEFIHSLFYLAPRYQRASTVKTPGG